MSDQRRMAALPLHPFLLVSAFVLEKAVSEGVGPPGFARPLLVGLAATALVTFSGRIFLRGWRIGGLVATITFLLLLSREPVVALLRFIRDSFGITGGTVVLVIVVALVVVGGAVGLFRLRSGVVTRRSLRTWTTGLNVFSVALIIVVSVGAVPLIPRWLPAERDGPSADSAASTLPDAYLILLDGYPRADELEAKFGFDNGDFLAQLQGRGFEVDTESRSNYTNTALTMPSLLEMEYLTESTPASFTDDELRRRLDHALRNGAGLRQLREAGYELVATSPGWEHVSLRTGMDRTIERPELTDLERFLLWRTWLPDLPGLPPNLYFRHLHSRVVGVLSDAAQLSAAAGERPVFAFVHVPAPHQPLAFDPKGDAPSFPSRMSGAQQASDYGMTDAEYASAYAAALEALNQHVIATVDEILRRSETPPVIVLTSDHGYHEGSEVPGNPMLHNLFAAYAPGHPGLFAESSTPVNLLRILLRAYSDADVGSPLPDRYFDTSITDHVTTITETVTPG